MLDAKATTAEDAATSLAFIDSFQIHARLPAPISFDIC